jgi:hypothetical protein
MSRTTNRNDIRFIPLFIALFVGLQERAMATHENPLPMLTG